MKEGDTALFIYKLGAALEGGLVQSPCTVCHVYDVLACDPVDRLEETVHRDDTSLLLMLSSLGNSKKSPWVMLSRAARNNCHCSERQQCQVKDK